MANLFFDAVSSSQTARVSGYRAPVGSAHARRRVTASRFTGLITTSDTARVCTLKSSDRIERIYVASDGGSTAGAIDIGLYETGTANDGAVIDGDLFASALTTSSAIAYVDQFKESSTLGDVDRLKPAWQLAALGAASYTEDPGINFDLTLQGSTTFTGSDTNLLIAVYYTSGD